MEQEYLYSKGMLERIIDSYSDIYGGIPVIRPQDRIRDEVLIFALSKAVIRAITNEPITYRELAELLQRSNDITDSFLIAEYKADFDMALMALGKGKWHGVISKNFRDYKYFGNHQRVIIAGMLGIKDYALEAWGFYQIPQLRGNAYGRMLAFLNEKSIVQNEPQS